MKKMILALGAIALVAAACNTAQPNGYSNAGGSATGQVSGEQQTGQNNSSQADAQAQAKLQAEANATVKVSNPSDAVQILQQDSSAEQTLTAGSDESDLTNSDSAQLNSFTGVSNGY